MKLALGGNVSKPRQITAFFCPVLWEVLRVFSVFSRLRSTQTGHPCPGEPWCSAAHPEHLCSNPLCSSFYHHRWLIGAKDIESFKSITNCILVAKLYMQRKFAMPCFKRLIYRNADHHLLHFKCFDPFILKSQSAEIEQ